MQHGVKCQYLSLYISKQHKQYSITQPVFVGNTSSESGVTYLL